MRRFKITGRLWVQELSNQFVHVIEGKDFAISDEIQGDNKVYKASYGDDDEFLIEFDVEERNGAFTSDFEFSLDNCRVILNELVVSW